jgi:hypothetical protein
MFSRFEAGIIPPCENITPRRLIKRTPNFQNMPWSREQQLDCSLCLGHYGYRLELWIKSRNLVGRWDPFQP